MKTKKRTNSKGKNRKTQKAGIRIVNGISPDKAFKFFIENSTFSYYNRGFFGILVLAKLNDGLESPYRHIRTNGIKKVKQLLLKFFEIKPQSIDIQREVNIQQTVYLSSLRNPTTLLEPICPCIVYSHAEVLEQNFKRSFYNIISQSVHNNKQIDQVFQGDVAFFAMEFMENYESLRKFENEFIYNVYKKLSLYTLDKLHSFGYIHGDFHDDNVLIIQKYNYFSFSKDNIGRAILIDFGETIETEETDRFKLLKNAYKNAHKLMIKDFQRLDELHKVVQDKYIAIFEKYYKCDINEIINSYDIYMGGINMGGENMKKSTPLKNTEKEKENLNLADQAEEEMKLANPEHYDELINSINETLDEEKKKPGYIKALFKSQLTNLIDPSFTLPADEDNPNKLRLIMD